MCESPLSARQLLHVMTTPPASLHAGSLVSRDFVVRVRGKGQAVMHGCFASAHCAQRTDIYPGVLLCGATVDPRRIVALMAIAGGALLYCRSRLGQILCLPATSGPISILQLARHGVTQSRTLARAQRRIVQMQQLQQNTPQRLRSIVASPPGCPCACT